MRIRVLKKNGLRSEGLRAACGDVVEVPDALGASLIASGEAAEESNADVDAPVVAAARNAAAKGWKKK